MLQKLQKAVFDHACKIKAKLKKVWKNQFQSSFEFRKTPHLKLLGERPLAEELLRLGIQSVSSSKEVLLDDYIYAPVGEKTLSAFHIENILLSLSHTRYSFIIVSHALKELPWINISAHLRDNLVFRAEHMSYFLKGEKLEKTLIGKVLRLMPGEGIEKNIEELFDACETCFFSNGELRLHFQYPAKPIKLESCYPIDLFISSFNHSKPLIFVMPVFMAVGGVERNTIEIMRQLKDKYDFVLITIERLTEKLGSLHHQLKGLVKGVFDLAELGPSTMYLPMLKALKKAYQPNLMWICNGSPWQCENSEEIRELFCDIPIVDQQVYDIKEGWINRYPLPGIQSFNRFIAVTRRIREKFVNDLKMDPSKIDLIYSAFDHSCAHRNRYNEETRITIRKEFGIPNNRPIFVFCGRLVEQKRPVDFLTLAQVSQKRKDSSFFIMIGDGQLAQNVNNFISSKKLKNMLRIPFIENVANIFALADGLVITSDYEGLPISMLQAISMELPVLSTDVGEIRLILEDYNVGEMILKTGIKESLVASFDKWRNQLGKYRENAEKAAPLIRERFSSANIAKEYQKCWERAMREFAMEKMRR